MATTVGTETTLEDLLEDLIDSITTQPTPTRLPSIDWSTPISSRHCGNSRAIICATSRSWARFFRGWAGLHRKRET